MLIKYYLTYSNVVQEIELKDWEAFAKFFTNIINEEVVYIFDGIKDQLQGIVEGHGINADIFDIKYNGELYLKVNELHGDSRCYKQIENIVDALWENSSEFFDLERNNFRSHQTTE